MTSIPSADGLDITSVRLFLDVVELGSVSKAAVRHRLAQPSATSRLQ
jgi:DNA-binding transcriptional LysR family regulator